MTYSGVDSAWNRACCKASVTDLRLHDLRHTAATNLLKVTNLKTVQLMLRHRDIRSTLRYAHADDRDLLAALEATRKSPDASPEVTVKPLKEKA
jgi:integrase